MDVVVTRKFKGELPAKKQGSQNFNSSTFVHKEKVIETILKSATTELTDYTFVIALNFIDTIPFEYKCPEDMIITEQLCESTDAELMQGAIPYDFGVFLAQFEVLTINPTNTGMVLLLGFYKK